MSKSQSFVSRSSAVAAAAILTMAALLPTALMLGRADAAQVTDRSIQLSNSATGATGVEYTIQFTLETASTNLEGIVVDICSGNTSPLIGTACSAPTSFSWGGTPTIVSADVGADDVSGWTVGTLNSNRTLTLSDATGVATAVNDVVTIVVSAVANPSDVDVVTGGNQVGTFYGRMVTFNDSAEVANYAPTNGFNATGVVDFGGAAMSTTNNLTVTARVQESLTFCVYTNGPAQDCSTGTGSAIDIPDATTPLSSSSLQTANAYFSLASNALSGVDVRMWSADSVDDGVLKSGTYTISPFGAGDDAACSTVSGANEQFGMRLVGSAAVTEESPYNGAVGCYGWDADNSGLDATKVGSSYGDSIGSTGGALDEEESEMIFAAKSALTTEAGIYTTDLNFIATGTY
jgi:hypothetical protein